MNKNLKKIMVAVAVVWTLSGVSAAIANDTVMDANFLQMESNYPDKYKSQLTAQFVDETRSTVRSFLYTDTENNKRECTVEEMRQGVVLLRALNKDMVRVDAPNFDPEKGGTVTLTFYRKFFGSDRRVVVFEFSREADGSWIVFYPINADQLLFDTLKTKVVTNALGMPTMIDKVDLKLDGKTVKQFETDELPKPKNKRFYSRPVFIGHEVE